MLPFDIHGKHGIKEPIPDVVTFYDVKVDN